MKGISVREFNEALDSMRNVVRRHTVNWPAWLSKEDAFAIGALAVVKAAKLWDRSKDAPFAVYIRSRVRYALLDDGRVRHLRHQDSSDYPTRDQVSLNVTVAGSEMGERLEASEPGPAETFARAQAARNFLRRWRTLTPIQRQVSALLSDTGARKVPASALGFTAARLAQIKAAIRTHLAGDTDHTDAQ